MKSEWTRATIEEACNVEYGTRVTKKRDAGKSYPVYGGGGETFRIDRFNRKNCMIIARFGMSERCTRFVEGKFFLNDSGLTLTPHNTSALLPRFLDYLILSLNKTIYSLGRGTAQKNLDVDRFRCLPIQFPPTPYEQKRIVAILDEAFDGIDRAVANAEKNLANARELFESYRNNVFTQKGEGWVEKTLEQVSIDFGRGKSKHRPRNDPKLYGGPYPFIQTGDVRNCEHLIQKSSQSYNETGLAQSKLWPKGTICITIAANIAETGILDFDACFPDSIIGIVVDEKQTSNNFIEYLLQSLKAQIKAKGKGSAQDNINLATFENELFPFPELNKQHQIVAKLKGLSTETQRLESIYQSKLTALTELKQALLQKAFSGELTANDTAINEEAVA
jgi:type I restriction enzyme, S subunit